MKVMKNGITWISEKTDFKENIQTIRIHADMDDKVALQFLVSIVGLCNNFAGVDLTKKESEDYERKK